MMWKKSLVLALVLFSTSVSAETLKGSVQKTLNNSPDVLAESYQKEAFQKYVDEAEGDYLPQVDIRAYAEEGYEKQYPDNAANTKGKRDGYNASVRLEQLIWDGNRTPAEIRRYEYERNAQKFKSNNNIETTVLGATRAYAELVQYLELLALTEGMIATNEDNLVIAKEKEEISGEILETYQVSSKLNFVTEQYLDEQSNESQRMSNLKRYIGEDPQPEFCRPVINEEILPKNLKDTIELALLKNNRILEEIERVKAQRERIAVADAAFLPSLTLELQASIDDDLELPENGTTKEVLGRLNLNWNIYNGGTDSATSEKEELFLKEAKASLDATTEEVIDEIRTVYQSFNKNRERIVALQRYVDANDNIVRVYKEEFDAGTRTFVDILNAQTEHYQSQQNLVNREFAYMDDYWTLLFNLGILSETILSGPDQTCVKKEPKAEPAEEKVDDELAGLLDEPVAAEPIEEEPITALPSDSVSFFQGNEGNKTINLATYYNKAKAQKFVENLPFSDETFSYNLSEDGKVTKVIYGNFKDTASAKEAFDKMDPNLIKVHRPFVDSMSKHIKLYDKYNK